MQSRKFSLIEAVTNTIVGYTLSLITLFFVNWFYNLDLGYGDSLQITAIFAFVSVTRNYVIRRIFNRINSKII